MRIEIVGDDPLLVARTTRSLARLGLAPGDALRDTERGVWFIEAGAWCFDAPAIVSSATGKPLLAFGATRGDRTWEALLVETAGDLDSLGVDVETPRVVSLFCEEPSALPSLDDAWKLARVGAHRAVRLHALDVGFDTRLRALVAITALHRGGAERIAIDLVTGLRDRGVEARLVVMDARVVGHEPPPDTIFLTAPSSRARIEELAQCARMFGADVIHTHLFGREELATLAAHEIPIVVTVHNDRARWPEGFDAVTHEDVALTLACSWRVREGLLDAARVAPNFVSLAPTTPRDRNATRRELEVPDDALMILCVANPRSQKRLDLAVETLSVVRETRDARLVIAGAPMPGDDGETASRAIDAAIARHALSPFVRRIGSQRDTSSLYAAADALLTTSTYEGMSVVQLEALAAGVPVVTTDVGGSRELAQTHDGYVVAAGTPAALAGAIVRALSSKRPILARSFERDAGARRHARAYRGAALARATSAPGLVLVINNFATGGAQASARRLLLELHARGHEVAAAVVQEQRGFPSPWRTELEAHIPVGVAPRAGTCDAEVTASAVASFVRSRGAARVVFWNVIPLLKMLIADELASCALHDVSPGEMYFAEMSRYFAAPRADLPYFQPRDYGTLLDGVVVKFAGEAERARDTLGVPVTLIPNGVPVSAVCPVRRPRGERFMIGTLARISPDKKLEQLIAAMRRLPRKCTLRIAGRIARADEAYAAELRASASDLPIEFVGEVDAPAFLADLDAFAMVSEPEGCPNALLEAMAAGLPIAATDAGGASDALDGDRCGLLVGRGDHDALAEALARLARDGDLAERLGRAAHARVAERFTIARMVDAYESVLLRGLRARD